LKSKLEKWQNRKNLKTFKTIGRMYPVNPTEGEKYYNNSERRNKKYF
jgi:hypothetical protein